MDNKQVIESYFRKLMYKHSIFMLSEHSKKTLAKGSELTTGLNAYLDMLKKQTTMITNAIQTSNAFIKEITKDLSKLPPKENYIYETVNGMLSYKGRDIINNIKEPMAPEKKKTQPPVIERVFLSDINHYIKLRRVTDLNHIPTMFNYYDNPKDKTNKPGIYCCISPNVYIKVQFPIVVDSTKDYNKGKSIRCKYSTIDVCNDQRKKMASYHKSPVRMCNFAHKNEKLVKIGYPSRCPILPRFGDAAHLMNDIKILQITDIKTILLHGFNDIISSAIWFDSNGVTGTYDDIDLA